MDSLFVGCPGSNQVTMQTELSWLSSLNKKHLTPFLFMKIKFNGSNPATRSYPDPDKSTLLRFTLILSSDVSLHLSLIAFSGFPTKILKKLKFMHINTHNKVQLFSYCLLRVATLKQLCMQGTCINWNRPECEMKFGSAPKFLFSTCPRA
jgi:hypothetical protein